MRLRYGIQKRTAKQRGIPWHLTYEQWLKIWTDSKTKLVANDKGYFRNEDGPSSLPSNALLAGTQSAKASDVLSRSSRSPLGWRTGGHRGRAVSAPASSAPRTQSADPLLRH